MSDDAERGARLEVAGPRRARRSLDYARDDTERGAMLSDIVRPFRHPERSLTESKDPVLRLELESERSRNQEIGTVT
jgi:hypothetical protein